MRHERAMRLARRSDSVLPRAFAKMFDKDTVEGRDFYLRPSAPDITVLQPHPLAQPREAWILHAERVGVRPAGERQLVGKEL